MLGSIAKFEQIIGYKSDNIVEAELAKLSSDYSIDLHKYIRNRTFYLVNPEVNDIMAKHLVEIFGPYRFNLGFSFDNAKNSPNNNKDLLYLPSFHADYIGIGRLYRLKDPVLLYLESLNNFNEIFDDAGKFYPWYNEIAKINREEIRLNIDIKNFIPELEVFFHGETTININIKYYEALMTTLAERLGFGYSRTIKLTKNASQQY